MAVDLNAIRNEYDRLSKDPQSNFLDNFVPMPEGEGSVIIRLLPPRGDLKLPFIATRTHKMNNKNLHCPMNLINGRWQGNCPCCNHYRSLWKQSDSASEDEAKALQAEARGIKPVERYYWNAIVRTLTTKAGEVQHNVGPKIFSCGKQLQSKLLRAMTGDEVIGIDGLGDITDVEGVEGRDLQVVKRLVKGSGNEKYPNYNESTFLKPIQAGNDDEISEWLESLHDLSSLRRILPQEELAREVRIHRGLEKDPDLDYNHGANVEDSVEVEDEPLPPPVVKKQARPTVAAQVQRPTATSSWKPAPVIDDEADEALADDDFLNRLKGM